MYEFDIRMQRDARTKTQCFCQVEQDVRCTMKKPNDMVAFGELPVTIIANYWTPTGTEELESWLQPTLLWPCQLSTVMKLLRSGTSSTSDTRNSHVRQQRLKKSAAAGAIGSVSCPARESDHICNRRDLERHDGWSNGSKDRSRAKG